MFGRVRMFNLGFAVFTVFSILLFVAPLRGSAGALWLIGMRIGQGIGGAMLFANSSAIITDALAPDQRGLALGNNGVAAIAGSFLGLIFGGLLSPLDWRLVFLVSAAGGEYHHTEQTEEPGEPARAAKQAAREARGRRVGRRGLQRVSRRFCTARRSAAAA